MRVLVCGGRDYQDRDMVIRTLDWMAEAHARSKGIDTSDNWLPHPEFVVIHGGCPTGADAHADDWAVVNWAGCEVYRADWDKHGKAAGPIRNQQMIDQGRPDLVLAFPGGRGTADMVRRAEAAGVPVTGFRRGRVVITAAVAKKIPCPFDPEYGEWIEALP